MAKSLSLCRRHLQFEFHCRKLIYSMVSSPSNPQQVQQFLSFVFSQRGPSSVPYNESAKWLIRQHLLNLISSYPSLEPKTVTFTHNDGRSINLLQADEIWNEAYVLEATYKDPTENHILEDNDTHGCNKENHRCSYFGSLSHM